MREDEQKALLSKQCEAYIMGFVRDWYNFGKSQKVNLEDDEWDKASEKLQEELSKKYIFRFIAYWVAFTAFLERNYGNRFQVRNNQIVENYSNKRVYEEKRIDIFFLDPRYSSLLSELNLLGEEGANFFIEHKLHCMSNGENGDVYEPNDVELLVLKRTNNIKLCNKVLLKFIYKVRNNLIHGQKRSDNEIDVGFVEASSNVMEKLIGELLKYNR